VNALSLASGRFGKQDFVYLANEDVYRCPAGERLVYHYANVEKGLTLRRYWTNVCQSCAIKDLCTTGKERRITRWESDGCSGALSGDSKRRVNTTLETRCPISC
jgi:hypothetical protein